VSTTPFEEERESVSERAGGFLAAISLTASAIAIFYQPLKLAPFAILVALIAAALASGPKAKLAGAAVVAGSLAWLVGMAVAVLLSKPIY
jgi:hypothetical protein